MKLSRQESRNFFMKYLSTLGPYSANEGQISEKRIVQISCYNLFAEIEYK